MRNPTRAIFHSRLPRIAGICAVLIPLVTSVSCKTDTYASKRNAEKSEWETYKNDHSLEISADSAYCFSRETPWPDNLYYQIEDGVYLHLTSDDPSRRAPANGNTVVLRYVAYQLDGTFYTDNIASRDGLYFVYVPKSSSPSYGLNYATAYLHQDSRAIVIIDSKHGDSTQQENVQTILFEIRSTTITN